MSAECMECGRWHELVFVPSGAGGRYLCQYCIDAELNGVCEKCGETLPAGGGLDQAAIAKSLGSRLLCPACVPAKFQAAMAASKAGGRRHRLTPGVERK